MTLRQVLPAYLCRQLSTNPRSSLLENSAKLVGSYRVDVAAGRLKDEPRQEACAERLDALISDLDRQQERVNAYNSLLGTYLDRRRLAVRQINDEDQERARRQKENWWHRKVGEWFPAEQRSRQMIQAERQQRIDSLIGPPPERPATAQGVYIYGSVGTGKTMLMDRFYAAAETKPGLLHRRMHFNSALLEVHSRMHAYEQAAKRRLLSGAKDFNEEVAILDKQAKKAKLAIRRFLKRRTKESQEALSLSLAEQNAQIFADVGAELMGLGQSLSPGNDLDRLFSQEGPDLSRQGGASERSAGSEFERSKMHTGVLCFDEININDPFTALALKGIFESLIDSGICVVATSNRPPWDLNLQGVHEAIFAHFKAKLMESCDALSIECNDFRRMADDGQSLGQNYLQQGEGNASLEQAWQDAVTAEGYQVPQQLTVPVLFGRSLLVNQCAGGVARFSFLDLCDSPKGPSDYHAISKHFHTVFITDIPVMSFQMRNMARRYITLLDELYNARCRLVCTAEGRPEELFATSRDGDAALFDSEQLEQLQFESAAEGSMLRRDVMSGGGVAPVFGQDTATVTTAFLGGLEESFAFARAVSRMYEMSRLAPKKPSRATLQAQPA